LQQISDPETKTPAMQRMRDATAHSSNDNVQTHPRLR
jgi:hypothetical protein